MFTGEAGWPAGFSLMARGRRRTGQPYLRAKMTDIRPAQVTVERPSPRPSPTDEGKPQHYHVGAKPST